jgi:hypothetical protein
VGDREQDDWRREEERFGPGKEGEQEPREKGREERRARHRNQERLGEKQVEFEDRFHQTEDRRKTEDRLEAEDVCIEKKRQQ